MPPQPDAGHDLTYSSYLHLDQILGAQHPVAPDAQGSGGCEIFGFGVLALQARGDFRRDAGHQHIARFR